MDNTQKKLDEIKRRNYHLAGFEVRWLVEGLERALELLEKQRAAVEDFRDTVLHQRGALAENGMTNDQVNDVLREFDAALDQPEEQQDE